MQKYQQYGENTYICKGSLDSLAKMDSLVLDIDGVILDVTGSFRMAISQTVQFFFSQRLGLSGSSLLVSPEETQLFKRAGGFNNDWDLTSAAVLFFLVLAKVFKIDDLDKLKARGDLEDFCHKIQLNGGGLEMAEKLALEEALPESRGEILREWQTDLIHQIFQEIYGGIDHCRRLYGYEPVYVRTKGLLNEEKVIIDKGRLAIFSPRLGILTGRTKEETETALEQADLVDLISFENIIYDNGIHRKPDPKVLEILGDRMGTKVGLYTGDIIDDLQTVLNYREIKANRRFLAGIVAKNSGEIGLYAKAGADIISLSTNDILDALNRLRLSSKKKASDETKS